MDINDLRAAFTLLAFVAFIGIVWWAYSDRRKITYEAAARLPLDDDEPLIAAQAQDARNRERKAS